MLWQNFRADYFQLEFQLQPSFAHKRIIKVCCNLTTRPIGLLILKFGRVRNIFEWPLEFISAIAHVCIYLFRLCVNLHIIIIFCLDDFYLLLLFSPRLFMVLPEFTMFCLAGYSRLKLRPFVSGSPRSRKVWETFLVFVLLFPSYSHPNSWVFMMNFLTLERMNKW